MSYVVVSSKGQLALPVAQRRRLGLGAGAKLELLEVPDGLHLRVVRPVTPVDDVRPLAGMVTARPTGTARRLDDFDPASIAGDPHQR